MVLPNFMPVSWPVLESAATMLGSAEIYSKRSVAVAGEALASKDVVWPSPTVISVVPEVETVLSAFTGFSTGLISMPLRRAVTILPFTAFPLSLDTNTVFASVP